MLAFGKKKLKKLKQEAEKAVAVMYAAVENLRSKTGFSLDSFIKGYLKRGDQDMPTFSDIYNAIHKAAQGRIEPVKFMKTYFPQIRGWVNVMRLELSKALKGDSIYFSSYLSPAQAQAALEALIIATAQVCALEPTYEICRQEMITKTGMKKQIRREQRTINLDALWAEKCGTNSFDPEWVDSMFCAMGKGNALANFVMRMQFVVPGDPNRNILQLIYRAAQGYGALDGVTKAILNSFLGKINLRERFRWSDLATVVNIINKTPGLKKYVDRKLQYYGISTQSSIDEEDTAEMRRARASMGRSVSLQQIWDRNCRRSETTGKAGEWSETLFCALGYNEPAAKVISAMRFEVPTDGPMNHMVIKLLDMISQGLQAPDPSSGTQSWKNWAIDKVLAYAASGLRGKIMQGQKLTWQDLNNLYGLTQVSLKNIPLIGNRIVSYLGTEDLSSLIEQSANDSLNSKGLNFVQSAQ